MTLTVSDIRNAAARLNGRVRTTPLIESEELNALAGARVFLKAENLQKAGAFKFRGAAHKVARLNAAESENGVITYSSGNHALALSLAAAEAGIPSLVLMPREAPAVKLAGARRYGAEVVLYDRDRDNRERMCVELMEQRGMTFVPPYDDLDVMAGAGTAALEAFDQLPEGATVDSILVCCSGGGLTSGWAVVARALAPAAQVLAVEPEGFDDTLRSLRAGERIANSRSSGTICDALLVARPGHLTFNVMRSCNVAGVTVSDRHVCDAMRFAFETLKVVLEPSGAAALAAVLQRKFRSESRAVLAILSGGNVDAAAFSEWISK
jgi:threonine dehydratase